MGFSLDDILVVGISSRALFDLDAEDRIFRREGVAAYRAYQRAHEQETLRPGTAFPLIRGLLAINERAKEKLVEVIVISSNDADSGLRIMNSVEALGLDIIRAAFTSGGETLPYLRPFHCDLLLSASRNDVQQALENDFAAALVLPPPEAHAPQETPEQVRIAFDGDAVLFDGESERVYQRKGLEAFQEREKALADEPLSPGPFRPFLMALKKIQDHFGEADDSPIRTSLVTARGAPAHRRVVHTLRQWGVRIDESFFLGGVEKGGVLEAVHAHIFFDDQRSHLDGARAITPSAHVLPRLGSQMALFGPPEEPEEPDESDAGADEDSAAAETSSEPATEESGPDAAIA